MPTGAFWPKFWKPPRKARSLVPRPGLLLTIWHHWRARGPGGWVGGVGPPPLLKDSAFGQSKFSLAPLALITFDQNFSLAPSEPRTTHLRSTPPPPPYKEPCPRPRKTVAYPNQYAPKMPQVLSHCQVDLTQLLAMWFPASQGEYLSLQTLRCALSCQKGWRGNYI